MNRRPYNPFSTLVTAGFIFFVGYAIEIAVDVWVVAPTNSVVCSLKSILTDFSFRKF
jgi:hypothetical protein